MERFAWRVFAVALCLSLAATQLQAGDQSTANHEGSSDATAVALGTPATSATYDSSRSDTKHDRLADANTDSRHANAAAAGGDESVSDDSASPDVAASADSSSAAANASGAAGGQDLITMNFQNVDLPVLAKFISEITGKNFILDENVRGKVSIISPTRVTPEQAYSIFQSVLQVKGFTTLKAGTVIKIIPSRDVRQSAELTVSQQPGFSQGDQYVTRMVKLRNTEATSVM